MRKEPDHEYIKRLISEYFSQKLFGIVDEIFKRKGNRDQELIEVHAEAARELEDE